MKFLNSLDILGSGGTLFDVQGSQGQLFSVTDSLSGSIFAVSDISGVPILDVNSSGTSYFSGSVGIGTSSPSQALQVEGNADINGVLYMDYGSIIDDGRLRFGNGNDFSIGYHSSTDTLRIADGNTLASNVRLSIDASGNVGIGTTSNSAVETNNGVPKLQVTTATAVLGEFPLAARFTTDSDAGDNSGVSVLINSGNDRGLMISAGRAVNNRARATLNLVQYDGNELVDGITLYQPNTASAGGTTGTNVGIGTTAPENKLHVQQPGLYDGTHTTAGIRIKSDGASADNNYHGTIALSRGTGSVAMSAVQEAADSDVMGIAFFTHPSATGGDAAVEKVRISADGNVGIGTDSPNSKLHVFGGSANTELKVTTNDNYIARLGLYEEKPGSLHGGFIQYRGESGDRLEIGSINSGTDTVHMSINDIAGNVGIGTTNPSSESNLSLGAKSTSEGGHLTLFKGTSNTHATHIDNYADSFRIMKGTDASSSTVQFSLAHATGNAAFAGDVSLVDSKKLILGTGSDLEIYHDPGHSYITNNTGDLTIDSQGDDLILKSADDFIVYVAGTEIAIQADSAGRVALRYDNTVRFQTTSTGATVSGALAVDGKITNLTAGTGNLDAVNVQQLNNATTGTLVYKGTWSAAPTTTSVLDGAVSGGTIVINAANPGISVGATITGTGISGTVTVSNIAADGITIAISSSQTIADGTTLTFTTVGGTPDLSQSSRKVTGHYYICETLGAATPNGAGTTPDEWAVGDWATFSDLTTDAWQKIDNSSVLSGAGTGGKVPVWSGSGTSVTLADAPITVSGNNSTFAGNGTFGGDVTVNGGQLFLPDGGDVAWAGGYSSGKPVIAGNSTVINMYPAGNVSGAQFSLSSTTATFAGTVTAADLLTVNGDGHLFLGADGETPKIDMMYVDHATGAGWDTRIFIGRTDDLPNGQAFPTSTIAGGFGTQYQANSDGAFFGIIPYATGHYRPVINWGDDAADSPFSFQFNGTNVVNISTGGGVGANSFTGDHIGTINTATTGVTQTAGNNSTLIATTAYADAAAAAGGGNFLPLAGGTMTGDVIFPGEEANSFKIAFTGASASSGLSTVDQSGAGLYIGANSRVNSSGVVVFHDTLLPSSGIYFDGWNGDDMEFYTGSSGNPTKRLTIEAGGDALFTGNVGIGTTSPSAKLHVVGDVILGEHRILNLPSFNMGGSSVTDEYLVVCKQAPSGGGVGASGIQGRISFSRGSSGSYNNSQYIDINIQMSLDSGNVNNLDVTQFELYRDSSSPFFSQLEEIDIDGTKYIALKARSSGGGQTNHLYFEGSISDASDTNILSRVRASDSTVTVTNPQPTGFPITPYITKNQDGNVGIGTTSPDNKLMVQGASTDGAASTGNVALFEGPLGTNGLKVFVDDTENAAGLQTISGDDLLMNPHGGNVGIGTTSPDTLLNVEGAKNSAILTLGSTDNNASWAVGDKYGAINFYSADQSGSGAGVKASISYEVEAGATGSTNSMVFRAAGNAAGENNLERMRITKDGNVGIGVTSPTRKLDVNSAAASDIARFGNNSGNFTFGQTTALTSLDLAASNAYRIRQGSTTPFYIKSDGNVGIGTTNPAYKLDVDGELRVGTVVPQTPADLSVRRNGANIEFGHGNRTSGYYGTIGVQGNNGMPYIALSADCESSVNTFTTRGFKGNVITTDGNGSLMFSQLTSANATGQSLTERMRIDSAGAIKFNAYGAGTLVTDASGNITVSSGGGAGGPYLPLTGGTLTGDLIIESALLSNQENTDVDTGTETVASVLIATYTAAFFDFVIKNGTNLRVGTVFACHDGTNVVYTETSTNDLGDTSDVTLSVDISGTDMRLRATVTSDDWSVKSLIRAI
jgi:fibronectin-binding autotransporter adhesin